MANIIIIANFCSREDFNSRFVYLADLLAKNHHSVEILTSDFNHGMKCPKDFNSNIDGVKVTRIHEPGYPNNVSVKRLLSHYIWGRNIYNYLKKMSVKPDVIYCAIPSLTAARLVGKYANKNQIKFITDIQDLWPEAFAIVVKNQLLKKLIFTPFHKYADGAYRLSDVVVGVSETYCNRALKACKKNADKIVVYLGNNGQKFDKAKLQESFDKPSNEYWVAYIGTLGYSYDLKCMIDAIAIAEEQFKNDTTIKFIVMGHGPLKQDFENYAALKNVDAVFTGKLNYEKMVSILCKCDVQANIIVKDAAQSITNKVGDYALSGLPVINTQENQEYRDLIDEYQCGINCEVGNANEVAQALIKLINNPELSKEMGDNSRRLGLDRFDRRSSYPLIVNAIEQLINNEISK